MFTATKDNFYEAQNFIQTKLSKLKLSDEEILLAQLMFEEVFFRFKHSIGLGNEDFAMRIKIRPWLSVAGWCQRLGG